VDCGLRQNLTPAQIRLSEQTLRIIEPHPSMSLDIFAQRAQQGSKIQWNGPAQLSLRVVQKGHGLSRLTAASEPGDRLKQAE
jgi:hypothetical protein